MDDDDDDAGDRDTETTPGKTTRTPPPNKAAAERGGVDDPNISRTSNDQYRVFSEQWNVDAERYALVSLLGSGSYGTVVKAFDKKYEMYVALKRISNALYSKQNAKRTLREIVALNRVSHPNVAELLDVFVKPATTGARKAQCTARRTTRATTTQAAAKAAKVTILWAIRRRVAGRVTASP